MTPDEPGRKKQEQKRKEEEAQKTQAAQAKPEEGKLHVDDLRTKSKLQERRLIEDIKRKPKTVEGPSTEEVLGGAEDVIITDKMRGDDFWAGGHGTKGDGIMHDLESGDHAMDVSKGMGFEEGPKGEEHGGGFHDVTLDAGDSGGHGGGHHATGAPSGGRRSAGFNASDVDTLAKEAVLRHWDSVLSEEGRTEGVGHENISQRRWVFEGMSEVLNDRMLNDLREIEDSTEGRQKTIRELNILKAGKKLDPEGAAQLRRMEDEEALRYWLREKLIRRAPLERQKKIPWLKPLGRGAIGVTPYTVLNSWDLLTPSQKRASRWIADNYLIRWQNAIVPQYLPKKPSPYWFKEKKKRIESLFDDVKEEEAYDKRFRANYRKFLANIDSMDKELSAYDKITADEEKKFAKMTADSMKSAS